MDFRFGRGIRALRVRRGWRQVDLGRSAGFSRSLVSKVELGDIDSVSVGSLKALAGALGGTLDVRVRWKGEGLDRLLDEAHSRLVDAVVAMLRAVGWEVAVEVSFSISGERGSIDVLAYHRRTGIVLVIEVKSVFLGGVSLVATASIALSRPGRRRGWRPVQSSADRVANAIGDGIRRKRAWRACLTRLSPSAMLRQP